MLEKYPKEIATVPYEIVHNYPTSPDYDAKHPIMERDVYDAMRAFHPHTGKRRRGTEHLTKDQSYHSLYEYIRDKIDRTKFPFIFVSVYQRQYEDSAHQNIFIIDCVRKKFLFLEPSNRSLHDGFDKLEIGAVVQNRKEDTENTVHKKGRTERFTNFLTTRLYWKQRDSIFETYDFVDIQTYFDRATSILAYQMHMYFRPEERISQFDGVCLPLAYFMLDLIIQYRPDYSKLGDFFNDRFLDPESLSKHTDIVPGIKPEERQRDVYYQLMLYVKDVLIRFRDQVCRKRYVIARNFAGLPPGKGFHGWTGKPEFLKKQGFSVDEHSTYNRIERISIAYAMMERLEKREQQQQGQGKGGKKGASS